MEAIGIDYRILIIQAVNFLILFFILRWLLYRPIINLLNERRNKIDESMKLADKSKKDSLELENKIKESLEQAKKDALSILDNAKNDSENLKKEILETSRKEADFLIQKAEARIKEQKQEMMRELRNETITLTIATAEKILGKEITNIDEKKLIEKTLSEIN